MTVERPLPRGLPLQAAETFRRPGSRAILLLCALTLGCQPRKDDDTREREQKVATPPPPAQPSSAAAPSASATPTDQPSAQAARQILATPVPQADIDRIVNPKGLAPYTGPTATIRGIVRVSGDAAVLETDTLQAIASDCSEAKKTFRMTPREGEGRTVADVLVAVTGYEAFLPQKEDSRVVRGVGCAWETRTVALMFGQTLRVASGDHRPYVPDLLGQTMAAQLFAMPGAQPVSLPPRKPGRYTLIDAMRLYNRADVFVVPYPTFAVTGLDGRFVISGIPPGKVKVNALLPASMAVSEREVELEAGETEEVELTVKFDAKAYRALKVELK